MTFHCLLFGTVLRIRPLFSVAQRLKMSTSASPNLVAVCQLTGSSDKEKNFTDAKSLITRGAQMGAKMIFLPETVDYISEDIQEALILAEPMDGPTVTAYRGLAEHHRIWLSLGVHVKNEGPSDNRTHNRHIVIDAGGKVVSCYDKVHLFDVTVDNSPIKESSWTVPGKKLVPPVPCPVGNVGLAICYDLRFPEMSLLLTRQGAEILTYPSAFMMSTGLAHWEPLLRARAIETQCYVIAAAQTGQSVPGRPLYGHSMVVDPWGQVVASCHEGNDVCIANIDLEYLKHVRNKMPVQSHRRNDVYG